jgi:hypothetical protein
MDDTPATIPEAADGQDVIQLERPECVDVMFVIDRSSSMGDDYEALAANIRSFVPALEGLLNEKQVDCGLGLHFVTTPWALGTGSQQRLYGLIPDYANTFVSGSLREDRGEKLVRWLAGSISTHKHTEPPLAAGLISHDIFGVFTLVTLL